MSITAKITAIGTVALSVNFIHTCILKALLPNINTKQKFIELISTTTIQAFLGMAISKILSPVTGNDFIGKSIAFIGAVSCPDTQFLKTGSLEIIKSHFNNPWTVVHNAYDDPEACGLVFNKGFQAVIFEEIFTTEETEYDVVITGFNIAISAGILCALTQMN